LDKVTLGLIEEVINNAIEQEDILERTKWVRDEALLKSPEDFVLEYILGSLMSTTYEKASRIKLNTKINKKQDKEWKEVWREATVEREKDKQERHETVTSKSDRKRAQPNS
jgi:hypothetical protein